MERPYQEFITYSEDLPKFKSIIILDNRNTNIFEQLKSIYLLRTSVKCESPARQPNKKLSLRVDCIICNQGVEVT